MQAMQKGDRDVKDVPSIGAAFVVEA